MSLALASGGSSSDVRAPCPVGPWQIGEVVQELLVRYEIDLPPPPACPVSFDAFEACDSALAAC